MNILFPKPEEIKEILIDFRDASSFPIEKKDIENYVFVISKKECEKFLETTEDKKALDYEEMKNSLKTKEAIKFFAKQIENKHGKGKMYNNFVKSLSNGKKFMGWNGEGKLNLLAPVWGESFQSIKVVNFHGNIFWEQGGLGSMRFLEECFGGQKVAYGAGFSEPKTFETFPQNLFL